LVWAEIAELLKFEARNLRDIRDRALVAVAYDTVCRRAELVLLRIEDIEPAEDGSGTIVIRRSKTDVTGEGATAYLPSVMQAGRWKNTRMPMRYGEEVLAARGGAGEVGPHE
jgi:integrase